MNIILDLKGYDGTNANTCSSNFRKGVQYIGINTSEEIIQEVTIPAASTVTLFTVPNADAKKLIYLESTAECDVGINGGAEVTTVKPVIVGSTVNRGIYLASIELETVDITNNDVTNEIKVYFITAK